MTCKTAYLCNINSNAACTKEMCIKNGGPCMATLDPKYAWRDVHGDPIVADDEDMREAAHNYYKKEDLNISLNQLKEVI